LAAYGRRLPFLLLRQRQWSNRARFFMSSVAFDRYHAPIEIKRWPISCLRPGGLAAPEERWYRSLSKEVFTALWLPIAVGANPSLAQVAGDPPLFAGDGDPASNSASWLLSSAFPWLAGRRHKLSKAAVHIE
jgi:hypothetical protein